MKTDQNHRDLFRILFNRNANETILPSLLSARLRPSLPDLERAGILTSYQLRDERVYVFTDPAWKASVEIALGSLRPGFTSRWAKWAEWCHARMKEVPDE